MSHGYENRHGRSVASDACCYGRVLLLSAWVCMSIRLHMFRSTLRQSRPNKAGLKCPSMRTHVRTFVRPQKVSSILMKCGMYVEDYE